MTLAVKPCQPQRGQRLTPGKRQKPDEMIGFGGCRVVDLDGSLGFGLGETRCW